MFSDHKVSSKYKLGKRHHWVKDMSKTLSMKISNYLTEMFDAKRDLRVKCLSNVLLTKMGGLTGETCSLEKQENGFQQFEAFLADRLALWLDKILEGEVDRSICREQHFKEIEEAKEKAQATTASTNEERELS